MGNFRELAINGLKERLQADRDWFCDLADGFEWWCHRLRQQVWLGSPGEHTLPFEMPESARLFVVTDVLSDLRAEAAEIDRCLGLTGSTVSGSSLVYSNTQGSARYWCSVSASEKDLDWILDVVAGFGLVQLVEAEMAAHHLAEALHADLSVSGHPRMGLRAEPDPSFFIPRDQFAAAGQGESPWFQSPEIQSTLRELVDQGAKGSYSEGGCLAELSFGRGSSMMRIEPGMEHPFLGSGVEISLHLPCWGEEDDLRRCAGALNRLEVGRCWMSMGHSVGSWRTGPVGDRYNLFHQLFLPTALYQEGILQEFARSEVFRNKWASGLVPLQGDMHLAWKGLLALERENWFSWPVAQA